MKKTKKQWTSTLGPAILEVMRQAGRPLLLREILKALNATGQKTAKPDLLNAMEGLVKAGKVVELKGNRYGLTDMLRLVTGRLSVHPDGFGFVTPDDAVAKSRTMDIFIPFKAIKGAIHGDRVAVRIEGERGRRIEGTVIRILERSIEKTIGIFHKKKGVSVVTPEDERLNFDILVASKDTMKAKDGQVVVVELLSPTEHLEVEGRNLPGRVIEILGDPDDMDVQVQIVIQKHQLPHTFSDEALKEADILPDTVQPEECAERQDLRQLPIITIDGETARDFDDAVHVAKTRTGYRLIVAIADVAHYIKKGSDMDKEAIERGTSVYFPNKVVPMLPEKLSNHMCSLMPHTDRLALVAEITFDKQGNRKKTSFYEAVIHSHRRCTYTEVAKLLSNPKNEATDPDPLFLRHLNIMAELAQRLHALRRQRGSIDFDLPEPVVVLGITGELAEIVKRERNQAHEIIEEFMIAANEAVADFFSTKEIPTLYRVHDKPDAQKMERLLYMLQELGIHMEKPEEITPDWCQSILQKVKGANQEYLINTMLLRSMRQAVYQPENIGHFGLASTDYLHFTSPIRRYPDLIVHRILKANLKRRKRIEVYSKEELVTLGNHTTSRERVAMEAEREMLERLKVRFMADKLGEVFDGIISAITSFGFFVELKAMFIEGVVRLVDLTDDYYLFDEARQKLIGERTRRVFQIGQEVRVRLKEVNIARRRINFELVNMTPAITKKR
jgi:ribonuclease R